MSEVKGTKALELWCKRLVKDCPDVQIENMTTSWRNGMAFCALVHHFRPDLIDISKLKPENIYENNQLAYSIAEKHLGIPALLDPEDMVENEVPDRLSVLTYLSQFYQRLGHTVNTKVSDNESKVKSSTTSIQSITPIKFGKVGLDKCAACGLPVYLAQRLIVSQKLYHRRCFRCSKCEGHLNPKNFKADEVSEFICDTCKNEKEIPKFLNNNDQVGMLAFNSDVCDKSPIQKEETVNTKLKSRPLSILEKINMFEKNIEKDSNVEEKIGNLSLNSSVSNNNLRVNEHSSDKSLSESTNTNSESKYQISTKNDFPESDVNVHKQIPDKIYKSTIEKFNFLQTQLSGDVVSIDKSLDIKHVNNKKTDVEESSTDGYDNNPVTEVSLPKLTNEECNITDDSRLAQNNSLNLDSTCSLDTNNSVQKEQEISISVPPRRKKNISQGENKTKILNNDVQEKEKEYPVHLNPFSDDDDDDDSVIVEQKQSQRKVSTNPFGSSDEDEDDVPPIQPIPKLADTKTSTPVKRHIIAHNPFWSDGEEPSSDEQETSSRSSSMHKSSITTSTPNLPASTPRRRKPRAPAPPPVAAACHLDVPSTSMDDVASISSFSSHTSTVQSDQKSFGVSTPKLKKKRPAPTPPDSLSTLSGYDGSLEKGVDTSGIRSNVSDGGTRRGKGPAPGLPLPARREVRLQLTPHELQVQLDLLETQQLGLERQGVLIEQMIRDKCEGDEACTVPQEEVEDLVIQLCELVNEKNDLFRKQTELMYIRRQQRLEQEQADIEHEIRVLQSQPAVNRIDADKAREEQLVCRLVETVRLRDELVQQLDAERRRERQEDIAIAASIATKRAQRNSDSNSSSMKSAEAISPGKKNKVKDKVKKQFKKAKHSLISKKKDDEKDKEKDKKPK